MFNETKYFARILKRIASLLTILMLPILVCWIKTAPAEQAQTKVHHTPVITKAKQHKSSTHQHKTHKKLKHNHTITKVTKQSTNISVHQPSKLASKKLIDFIDSTVDNLNYNNYKLGGEHFDTNKGIYSIDCSRFVDVVLKRTYPNAYYKLVNATGTGTPASLHYYNFFHELPENPKQKAYWNHVDKIKQLRPGDILVFRYKKLAGHNTTGHVMVIMNKPIRASLHTFFVRVADAAPIRHSEDTRLRHESGIGIGTLLLKLNPSTGKPTAYAWEKGGTWKHNVNFAMARPIKFDV